MPKKVHLEKYRQDVEFPDSMTEEEIVRAIETDIIPFLEKEGKGQKKQSFDTKLTSDEEKQFQSWKGRYAPRDSGEDYDLRGAFKAGLIPDPKSGHWPDTYKKPNHPTFSVESIYAKDAPDKAGRWEGETYIPPGRKAEFKKSLSFPPITLPKPPAAVQQFGESLVTPLSTHLAAGMQGLGMFPKSDDPRKASFTGLYEKAKSFLPDAPEGGIIGGAADILDEVGMGAAGMMDFMQSPAMVGFMASRGRLSPRTTAAIGAGADTASVPDVLDLIQTARESPTPRSITRAGVNALLLGLPYAMQVRAIRGEAPTTVPKPREAGYSPEHLRAMQANEIMADLRARREAINTATYGNPRGLIPAGAPRPEVPLTIPTPFKLPPDVPAGQFGNRGLTRPEAARVPETLLTSMPARMREQVFGRPIDIAESTPYPPTRRTVDVPPRPRPAPEPPPLFDPAAQLSAVESSLAPLPAKPGDVKKRVHDITGMTDVRFTPKSKRKQAFDSAKAMEDAMKLGEQQAAMAKAVGLEKADNILSAEESANVFARGKKTIGQAQEETLGPLKGIIPASVLGPQGRFAGRETGLRTNAPEMALEPGAMEKRVKGKGVVSEQITPAGDIPVTTMDTPTPTPASGDGGVYLGSLLGGFQKHFNQPPAPPPPPPTPGEAAARLALSRQQAAHAGKGGLPKSFSSLFDDIRQKARKAEYNLLDAASPVIWLEQQGVKLAQKARKLGQKADFVKPEESLRGLVDTLGTAKVRAENTYKEYLGPLFRDLYQTALDDGNIAAIAPAVKAREIYKQGVREFTKSPAGKALQEQIDLIRAGTAQGNLDQLYLQRDQQAKALGEAWWRGEVAKGANGDLPHHGTAMFDSPAHVETILSDTAFMNKTARVRHALRQLNDHIEMEGVKSGVISQNTLDIMRRVYPGESYLHLRTITDLPDAARGTASRARGHLPGQKTFQRTKQGGGVIENVYRSSAERLYNMTKEASVNDIGRTIAGLSERGLPGFSDIARVLTPQEVHQMGKDLTPENSYSFLRDGRKVTVLLEDELLARSLRGMGETMPRQVMDSTWFKPLARLGGFVQGTTGFLNPVFQFANVQIDTLSRLINGSARELMHFGEGSGTIVRDLAKAGKQSVTGGDLSRDATRYGAGFSTAEFTQRFSDFRPEQQLAGYGGRAKRLNRAVTGRVRKAITGKPLEPGTGKIGAEVWSNAREAGLGFEKLMSSSERFSRLHQFEGSRRALRRGGKAKVVGDTPLGQRLAKEFNFDPNTPLTPEVINRLAALEANGSMIRYNTIGAHPITQVWMIATPYLSANLNAPRPFLRALRQRPGATSLKIATAVVLPQIISSIYNLSDPERAKKYKATTDYEKDNYFFFVADKQLQDLDRDVAIPIPNFEQLFGEKEDSGGWSQIPGLKVRTTPHVTGIARITRRVMEQIHDQHGEEGIAALANELFGEDRVQMGFPPINAKELTKDFISGVSPLPLESASAAASAVIPHTIKLGMELGGGEQGTDFHTGRIIVPRHVAGRGTGEQFDWRTPQLAVDVGKRIGVAPKKVEHAGRAVFGSAFPAMADLVERTPLRDTPPDERGGESYPAMFERRFAKLAPDVPRPDTEAEDKLRAIQSSAMRRRQLDVFSKVGKGFDAVSPVTIKAPSGKAAYTEDRQDYEARLKKRGEMLGKVADYVLANKDKMWEYRDEESGKMKSAVWDKLPRSIQSEFLQEQQGKIDQQLRTEAEILIIKKLRSK